jgi:carbon storage regulator CsrA
METKPHTDFIIRKRKEEPTTLHPRPEPDRNRGYLCVTRYATEPRNSIMIGDVEIEVIEIRGGSVRLGIHADRSVPIERKERLAQKKIL